MRTRLCLALLAAHSLTPALAANLVLTSPNGQTLHVVPLQPRSPLTVGDMTTASQVSLQLRLNPTTVAHTITLATAQPLAILPNGDLEARCQTTPDGSACAGLPSTQPAVLSRFTVSAPIPPGGSRPRIALNTNFRIEWASTNAELCVSDAPSQLQNWSGRTPRAGSGIVLNARFTALPSANPALLNLTCYGSGGSSIPRTLAIDVAP